ASGLRPAAGAAPSSRIGDAPYRRGNYGNASCQFSRSDAERSAKLLPPARTLKLGKTRMAAPISFSRWFAGGWLSRAEPGTHLGRSNALASFLGLRLNSLYVSVKRPTKTPFAL